jgi:hypothetical protein
MVGFIIINSKTKTMNRSIITICLAAIVMLSSCKKDTYNWLTPSHPEIPVTVTNNYVTYNGVPHVQTSLAGGGNISIQMEIPASSGRTIKEITKVALGANAQNYVVVQNSTAAYNTAPIAGSGNKVTFTTTLAEFATKSGTAPITTGGTATSFISRYFYFLITLDNGQQLIPVPVRVYVNT